MTQANPAIPEMIEPASPPAPEQLPTTATALMVLGMHRSGTSAMARVLNLLGVELGADLLPPAPDNETGFWEHRQVQFVHDRIYEDLRRDWTHVSPMPAKWWERPEIQSRRDQLKEVLVRDFGARNLWGIKDPRLCSMLPLWIPMLADLNCQPKCVLIFRNPLEVVRSLEKRDGMVASRIYLLWVNSVIDSERYSRNLPRTMTTYGRVLADWSGQVSKIGSDLGIDWPVPVTKVEEAVASFIRPASRHHQVEDEQFLADETVPRPVRRLYLAALKAVESGQSEELSVVVDEIADKIEHGAPLKTSFIRDLEAESRNTVIARNIAANEFRIEIANLKIDTAAQIAARDTQLAGAAAEISARDAQLAAAGAEHMRLGEAVRDLTDRHQQVTTELGLRTTQLTETEAKADLLATQLQAQLQTAKSQQHLIEELRAEQVETNQAMAKLTNEYASLRAQLLQAYQTRDTLGAGLAQLWKSRLWRWGRPAWLLARALGKLDLGMPNLIPSTEMTLDADGTWRGSAQPQFLIPTPPLRGWVRVRAKLHSAVSSRACLYFDTGSSFHQGEHFELAAVAGDTEIDRMVPLRKPTFFIRFDPVQAPGEFVLREFSLEPVSSLWFNSAAVLRNLKMALLSSGPRRPSIWLGLKLLFTGKLSKFHQQLVNNVGSSTAVSEYDLWRRRHEITDRQRQQMRDSCAQWENPPMISVILPVYDVPEVYLRKCIDSVLNQIYPNWELCIADDASPKPHIKKVLQEYAAKDSRIKMVCLPENGGISTASNAALALATGEYIALLDHDDELAEHALYRCAEAIVDDPSLDMLYSDEDKLTADDERHDPFFKPDWSPEYFLACMYTCHLGVYRTETVKRVGGWRKEFDGSQDYDLVLRIIAANPNIHHIADVLYHWRTLPSSTASGASAKPKAHLRAQAALQSYLDLTGRKGRIEDGPAAGFHRVRYEIQGNPKVSVVIPSACHPIQIRGRQTWLALECVSSIRRLSTYKNLEIIVLDDNQMSEELEAALKAFEVRRIPFNGPFNFSSKMNLGCFAAEGEHLVTMNDDVEVISPDWIESMLEFSQWPEIGAVGAQLLFPDNTQQHTGVTVLEGNPGHPFYHSPADHPGYYFSSKVHRNWSAVTAACLMTRADVFKNVGGFTESFPLNYNDVDYCMKVLETKKRIVCVPFAKLYHHESLTKSGTYAEELANFKKVWSTRFPRDPYYNPNLSTHAGDFRIG